MKNKTWLACIVIFSLINLLWFWPGNLYFLNDDLLHIPLTDQGYLFQTNSVRPLHELLVRLDLFFWNKKAAGFHTSALLLHVIVCLQLYFLCLVIQMRWLKIEREQALQASLLAVVLFLIYPQSAKSIAWIIGRTPVLSAIFFLVTVQLFFNGNYRWPVYLLAALFFAASLFTYEQTLFLPLALLWIVFMEKDKTKRRRQFLYAIMLIIVDVVYVIVRKIVTSEVVGTYEGGNLLHLNWMSLAANAFRLLFRLVLNPASKVLFAFSCVVLFFLVVLIVRLFWKKNINNKAIVFFVGIIVLLVAPVISLGLAVNSFKSGRYLYLPSLFFIAAISVAGVAVFTNSPAFRKPLILLLILLSGYWLFGKYTASKHYLDASSYSRSMQHRIQQHFQYTSDTLYIDTLRVTVHRLPVFRLGFKTGVNWFNNNIDTNKIVVKYRLDEVLHRSLE